MSNVRSQSQYTNNLANQLASNQADNLRYQKGVKNRPMFSNQDTYTNSRGPTIKGGNARSRVPGEKWMRGYEAIADEKVGPDRWVSRTSNIGDELKDPTLVKIERQRKIVSRTQEWTM